MDNLDIPTFSRKQSDSYTLTSDQIVSRLNHAHSLLTSRRLKIKLLRDLEQLGVDKGAIKWLNKLVDEGYKEEMVVIAWLSWFIDSDEGSGVSRHVCRLIHKSGKRLDIGEELKVRMDDLMDEGNRFIHPDMDSSL